MYSTSVASSIILRIVCLVCVVPLLSGQFLYLGDRDIVVVQICAENCHFPCIIYPFSVCVAKMFTAQFPVTSPGMILSPSAYYSLGYMVPLVK
jgi:hypothetical protein